MRCIVTGGAGFIGSNLVDKLIKDGHDVIVIDNLSTGKKENINSKASFSQIDLGNKECVPYLNILMNHVRRGAGLGRAPKAFLASSTRPWRHAHNARSYPSASGAARRHTTRPKFTGTSPNVACAACRAVTGRAVDQRPWCARRRVPTGLSRTADVDGAGYTREITDCILSRVSCVRSAAVNGVP